MPYAIGRTVNGVYEVVPVRSKHEAIVKVDVVIRDGHAKVYEFMDEAEKECKGMNKERLAKHRELKKSQMGLGFGGGE